MAKKDAKPESFKRFEDLARKVLTVPKKDVDKKEAERPKRKHRTS